MYLTCGFKSIYFSFCNCFPTKLVIHLVCEHFDSVPDISEQGRQRHSEKWARPGEHRHKWGELDRWGAPTQCWWELQTALGQRPRAGWRRWEQETQEGPGSYPGLVFVVWLMKNRRQQWVVTWRAEEPSWWPAGRSSVPSGLRTDILGTYSIAVFKEKWESAPYRLLPHSITPLLCHLLFLRQEAWAVAPKLGRQPGYMCALFNVWSYPTHRKF